MVKTSFRKHRVAVLLAAFVTVSAIAAITAIAAIAASTRAAATAHGRALVGNFCTTSTGSMFCMTLTDDGVAYGTTNRAELALRPGTYWITLDDNSPAHDFALRSCPSST